MTELQRLLRSKAVLLPGVTVTLTNAKTGDVADLAYDEGLRGYLTEALAQSSDGETVIPLFEGASTPAGDEGFAEGEGAAWVVAWTEEGAVVRESYVNLIPTSSGGTHESGLRDGLFGAVKSFVEMHSLLPKGVKLLPEDVFARVSFVLSAKVLDPQFQGQIKERLNSRDAVKLVSTFTQAAARTVAEPARRLRQEAGRPGDQAGAIAPALAAEGREEEVVGRGRPAGQADRLRIDRHHPQRTVPGRGRLGGRLGQDGPRQGIPGHPAAARQGAEHLGDRPRPPVRQQRDPRHRGGDRRRPAQAGDTPDLSGLRYGKICILSDADVDGSHIQVLLLTLFFKHFPALFANGHICVARPPLYRVDAPARGKKPIQKLYALDDGELLAIEDKLRKEGLKEGVWSISRFKGLGEMNAEQLWETTMNPDTRRLLPVSLGDYNLANRRRASIC
jgi:topoisomerase-4 subunit B